MRALTRTIGAPYHQNEINKERDGGNEHLVGKIVWLQRGTRLGKPGYSKKRSLLAHLAETGALNYFHYMAFAGRCLRRPTLCRLGKSQGRSGRSPGGRRC